ncbi:MAG: TetR/AcrR family transcriptional regulator [Deltaproteobacteria bacterium]|nr:MAG: TetR/AcrR family transcriptional regulator [Deltaproteobacteria bacterium]
MARRKISLEKRREKILTAAEALVAEKGFSSFTMEDLSRETGLGMRSLYSIFPRKESILKAVVERKVGEIRKFIMGQIGGEETASGKVRALIFAILQMREMNREMLRFYVFERHLFEWDIQSELGEEFHSLYRDLLFTLKDLIQDGVRRGEFSPIDPRLGAALIMGSINTLTYLWLYGDEERNLMEDGKALWDLFLRLTGGGEEEEK